MKLSSNFTHAHPRPDRGFTRLELFAVLGAVSLLACCALPLLAGNRQFAGLSACANNLRQVGQATRLWANDHIGEMPWRTPVAQGGNYRGIGTSRPGNAWFEWVTFSNELVTPKILVCPSDPQKIVARDWSNLEGGFLNAVLRNNAVSYIVGLGSFAEAGRSIISGDRNIKYDVNSSACSAGVNNAAGILSFGGEPWTNAKWTNAVHGEVGHLLLNDGAVERTSSKELRVLATIVDYDNGSVHFVSPR